MQGVGIFLGRPAILGQDHPASLKLSTIWNKRVKMARPEGLEPPAYWFEANRSIQLSYGRGDSVSMVPPAARPLKKHLMSRMFVGPVIEV